VVDRFGRGSDTTPPAVLAQVLVTQQDTRSSDFPWPTVSAFVPALACFVVTPAIAGMLLLMAIAIAAGFVRYSRAACMSTRPLSSCWHE